MNEITIEELLQLEQPLVVDIRNTDSFERGTIPGTKHIPVQMEDEYDDPDVTGILSLCPKGPIYLLCHTGANSMPVAQTLREAGCEAYSIAGGYRAYLNWKLRQELAAMDDTPGDTGFASTSMNSASNAEAASVSGDNDNSAGPASTSTDNASSSEAASVTGDNDNGTGAEQVAVDNANDTGTASASMDNIGDGKSSPNSKITKEASSSKPPRGRRQEIERSLIKKFRKQLWCRLTKAVREYELIQDGDKIAVCISGGKDSMLMAKLMQEIQRHGTKRFEIVYLCMNPGYNEENWELVQNNARLLGIPLTIFESDIFDAVEHVEHHPCYLCARMRRGYLYSRAQQLGCNKIALGHHYDDVIETILMGILYAGKTETMMPKLHSQHFPGMELIRPLYLIREADIKAWCKYNDLHFIQCACRFTESCSVEGGNTSSKRAFVKRLIRELSQDDGAYVEQNIFNCVRDINLRTVIGYHKDGKSYHFLDDYDGAQA